MKEKRSTKNFTKRFKKVFGLQKTRFTRLLLILFCIILGFIAIANIGIHVLSKEISQNRDKITQELQEKLGFPIEFTNIQTHWVGLGIGATIHNVKILPRKERTEEIDQTEKTEQKEKPENLTQNGAAENKSVENIPIAEAVDITLVPSLWSLVRYKTIQPRKIIINGLKIEISWDKNGLILPFDRNSSHHPDTLIDTPEKKLSFDYQFCLAKLSEIPVIRLKNAEIHWQGPNLKMKQWLNAKFSNYKFSGNQQWQIRNGNILPSIDFTFEIDPKCQFINFVMTADPLEMNGRLEKTEEKNDEQANWQTSFAINVNALELEELHEYYSPQKTDLKLLQWFSHTLKQGTIDRASFKGAGPFKQLKWSGEIAYSNVDYQYAPAWPKLEKAEGFIQIDNQKASVTLKEGSILGIPIAKATATVEPLKPADAIVKVEGSLTSTLEKSIAFLKQSPLQESIGDILEPMDPEGPMTLQLKLAFPLAKKILDIQGIVSTNNASLDVPGLEHGLNDLSGDFHFTSNTVTATKATAEWMKHPVDLSVETLTMVGEKNAKFVNVSATSLLSSEFLQEQLQYPFIDKFKGESNWTIQFLAPLTKTAKQGEKNRWIISSDLHGTAIELPKPLHKEADAKQNFKVSFRQAQVNPASAKSGEEASVGHKIELSLDKVLDAKLLTVANDDINETENLQKGHIVFGGGRSNLPAISELLINGEATELDIATWIDFFKKFETSGENNLPPLNIHLLINDLETYGLHFKNTWIMSRAIEQEWSLDGPGVKGIVKLPSEKNNNFTLNLEYLKLASNQIDAENSGQVIQKQKKYPIYFQSGETQFDQIRFGAVSFRLVPASYGYAIQSLRMGSSSTELTAQGEWHQGLQQSYTTLTGKIDTRNFGQLLVDWGQPVELKEGTGTILYQIRWPKNPFQFSLGLIEGTADIHLKKGRIMGVNPGLGRILGLLSIENIARRLQLDFSDVFKQGFAFDKIKGSLAFRSGIAQTDELLIDGPSAKIQLAGQTNLKDKTLDLNMSVTPQSGIGLPIAGVVALVNPIAGAGVAVLNQISSAAKITQQKYHVTGTWSSPVLDNGRSSRTATKPTENTSKPPKSPAKPKIPSDNGSSKKSNSPKKKSSREHKHQQ